MKERRIMFSAQMVRAIREGRKTQTRRVVKLNASGRVKETGSLRNWHLDDPNAVLACPYGQPGDRLWVPETWQHSNYPLGPCNSDCDFFYRADYHDDPHGYDGEKSTEGKYRQWRPSSNMPRYASRILLEIVSVRVERLLSIRAVDVIAEGVEFEQRYPMENGCLAPCDEARAFSAFHEFCFSINGYDSWYANPWVWVVEFRRITP